MLEAIVVRLEPVLKARFLPWLQPGSPEEADRRDKEGPRGHTFFMWPTSGCLGVRGGAFNKDNAESRGPCVPRQSLVGHIKKVCPSGPLIAPIGYRPPQESLAVAKAKSAPLNPVPN